MSSPAAWFKRAARTLWPLPAPLVIGLFVAIGLGIAGLVVSVVSEACFEATAAKAQFAPALWGLFRVSATFCRDTTKQPPWLLLSGLVASPSVLLTWYWREAKRRDDHANKRDDHRLAYESGIAGRYAKAAELLASPDLMARTAGLFALWDIARESNSHRLTVRRTVAAYVRERTGARSVRPDSELAADAREQQARNLESLAPASDVQNAMAVLADDLWSNPEWFLESRPYDADLRSACLCSCDLRDARLSHTNFANAQLMNAFFRDANLIATNFEEADVSRALFNGSRCDYSSFAMGTARHAHFTGARLRHARCNDADFEGAVLDRCDLYRANFERARLEGASLTYAALCSANFTNANLSGANLSFADMREAVLVDANLRSAQLAGANLSNANLCGADFGSIWMGETQLTGATYDEATRLPDDVHPAKVGMIATQRQRAGP